MLHVLRDSFDSGAGFRNPSVYCRDPYRLITHIRRHVADDVALLTAAPR